MRMIVLGHRPCSKVSDSLNVRCDIKQNQARQKSARFACVSAGSDRSGATRERRTWMKAPFV